MILRLTVAVKIVLSIVILSDVVCSQKLAGYVAGFDKVCNTIDIRNNVEELNFLKGCRVIVGSLKILLFETARKEDFNSYSFPELREVTGYVLLYWVVNLTTLSKLFPNLSLIRGKSLLLNYALSIYNLPQLEDIGLGSLTTIQRGSVRIENNNNLCYVNTINWNVITGREEEHYVKVNANRTTCAKKVCKDSCSSGHCWNEDICQKIRSEKNDTKICHKECYGGCDPITKDCYACRHFTDNGVCVKKCPNFKYVVSNTTYCVTKEECASIFGGQSWTWRGVCRKTCPKGYYVHLSRNTTCVKCPNNKCNKVCGGVEVASTDHAQSLRGCTIINGSLQIRLIGYQSKYIMKELEENLSEIETIEGFLKIYRSLRINSLAFFKNLKTIRGNQLENDRNSLIVYDMQNLQNLFDFNHVKNLTLVKGGIFFHFNPKLCKNEIDKLVKILIIDSNITDVYQDVSRESNGYKVGCDYDNLDTNSEVLGKHDAIITWEKYSPKIGEFLGYNIYYVESIDDDVTTEYGEDSCYDLSWTKKFISQTKSSNTSRLTVKLNNLKSSTKYAYYVETITKQSEYVYRMGDLGGKYAQSTVKYFITTADIPPPPTIIRSVSMSDSSITIFWINDLKYDSLIRRYTVKAHILEDENDLLDKRDYCVDPLRLDYVNIHERTVVEPADETECDCQVGRIHGQSKLSYFRNRDFSSIICNKLEIESDFENKTNCMSFSDNTEKNCDPNNPEEFQVNDMYYIYSKSFKAPTNNFTFKNLRPYGKYILKVNACIGNRNIECGGEASTVQRVQKNLGSDDIMDMFVTVDKDKVDVFWYPPGFPNGAVLAYNIQYSRTDITDHKPVTECYTRKKHESNDHKFTLDLPDGSYKIRVAVVSLAGYGNYTDYYYFKVPYHQEFQNKTLLTVVCCIVLIISTTLSFYCFRKRRARDRGDQTYLLDNMYTGVKYISGRGDDAVSFMTESILDYDRDPLPKTVNTKLVWGYENRGAEL